MFELGLGFAVAVSVALDYFFGQSCGDVVVSFLRK